jgi:hypothetical protein
VGGWLVVDAGLDWRSIAADAGESQGATAADLAGLLGDLVEVGEIDSGALADITIAAAERDAAVAEQWQAADDRAIQGLALAAAGGLILLLGVVAAVASRPGW